MDEKELKELLLERLHLELYLFKDSMLRQTKKEIYEASFKIEVYVNVYEILLENVESLDTGTVRGLLDWKYGILESLYQEWLGYQDNSFDELKAYVGGVLEMIVQLAGMAERREQDGTGFNQAA